MHIFKRLLLLSTLILAVSCGKEGDENTNEAMYNRMMESWVKVNYPTKTSSTTDSGAYILEFNEGTGEATEDTSYVFVHYIKTDMEGDITDTNLEDISRQLRTYSNASYYGPDVWRLGDYAIPIGLEEVLLTMKVGGSAKVALTINASTVENPVYNAFSSAQESSNVIYTIWLEKIERDIYEYQIDSLESYRDRKYPGVDSVETGFYFKKIVEYDDDPEGTGDRDTISDGTTVYTRYIARRIEDGKVFDTNIQDTAKKYRIYSSSGSYSALTLTYYNDEETMMSNNTESIQGYTKIVARMNKYEQAVGFFWSDLGYSYSGSGTSVPEYGMLEFTIWLSIDDDD